MNNHRKFWNRVGCVKIEDSSGKMVEYRGLDFKFKVKSIAGIYNEFSVSILGLSTKTINDLTIWNPVIAFKKARRIEVYAGYAKTGEEVVASGYIWYAVPERPPEMWMNFECRQFLKYEEMVEKPRVLENVKLKDLFNTIAAECGYSSEWRASDGDSIVKSYSIDGKKGGLIQKFVKTFNKRVCSRFRMYICDDLHGERKEPRRQKNVSTETGLLAVNGIDINGAKITTRLRSDIQTLDWINLKSVLIPSSSGSYFVIETEAEGHLRGEKWQSTYKCLRQVRSNSKGVER
jgi:hypothetical protein